MWNCVHCREAIEDSFDACWRCGTTKDGKEDPNFKTIQAGEFAVANSSLPRPAQPRSSAGNRHKFASILVWVLRGLAFAALIWGVINLNSTMTSSRVARNALNHDAQMNFQGDENQREKAEPALRAVAAAASTAVFTAVIHALILVTVLLSLAEGLRIAILVERNTRSG